MPRRSQVSVALEESLEDEQETTKEPTTQKSSGFDFNKYKVDNTPYPLTLDVDGETFDITVKPLTWSNKNKFLSKCLRWDTDGNTVFDGDLYVRECLKEMILTAPWGKTTELFLISIDARLGNVLESIVPNAFGSDMSSDIENLKGR
tara:strand:+ start:608 stop:1048 length:441 start_codon:yes stop_codon:yes gene_type:complete